MIYAILVLFVFSGFCVDASDLKPSMDPIEVNTRMQESRGSKIPYLLTVPRTGSGVSVLHCSGSEPSVNNDKILPVKVDVQNPSKMGRGKAHRPEAVVFTDFEKSPQHHYWQDLINSIGDRSSLSRIHEVGMILHYARKNGVDVDFYIEELHNHVGPIVRGHFRNYNGCVDKCAYQAYLDQSLPQLGWKPGDKSPVAKAEDYKQTSAFEGRNPVD